MSARTEAARDALRKELAGLSTEQLVRRAMAMQEDADQAVQRARRPSAEIVTANERGTGYADCAPRERRQIIRREAADLLGELECVETHVDHLWLALSELAARLRAEPAAADGGASAR